MLSTCAFNGRRSSPCSVASAVGAARTPWALALVVIGGLFTPAAGAGAEARSYAGLLAGTDRTPPNDRASDSAATDSQSRAQERLARARDRAKGAVSTGSRWASVAIEWLAEKSPIDASTAKGSVDQVRRRAEEKLLGLVDDAMKVPLPHRGWRVLRDDFRADAAGAVAADDQWQPAVLAGRPGAAAPPEGLAGGRVVVLVHGLHEPGSVWGELAPALARDGFRPIRYDYMHDEGIAVTAAEFARAMGQLRAAGVERVDVVAHSMGGLVVRDALTRPAHATLAMPRVDRFIMVGTPNHGAPLARLTVIAEAREHLERWLDSDSKDPRSLLAFLADGDGQVGRDLLPESEFLTELNARPRNGLPAATTIIAGSVAGDYPQRLGAMLDIAVVRRALEATGGVDLRTVQEAIRRGGEVVGDGVVSVDSAKLIGIDDTVVLPTNHRHIIANLGVERAALRLVDRAAPQAAGARVPSTPQGIPIILDRLKRPLGSPAPSSP